AEGDLLLLVLAAQCVAHSGRDQPGLVERRLHLAADRAEVAVLFAAADRHYLLEVFAHDLRLAGDGAERRDALERKDVPVGSANGKLADVTRRAAETFGDPHAHIHELR